MAYTSMPRPGQAAQRKRNELAQDQSDSDDYYMDENPSDGHPGGIAPLKRTRQVLPVADLGEEWDGEVEDGATFLALANRSNAKLPSFTRAENPYRLSTPPPSIALLPTDPIAQAGPSRHPALPTEAWATLFASHYTNYRADVSARWPPDPLPPYPANQPGIPNFEERHEWFWYINGFARRKTRRVVVEDTGADEQEDEEDFMNAPPVSPPAPVYDLEPESERHRPREPTISILAHLNSRHVITILIQLSYHLSRHIDRLTDQLQFNHAGNPDSATPLNDPNSNPHPNNPFTNPPSKSPLTPSDNPYTAHLARWTFSILLILNTHLLPDDLHVLRQFARDIMRVGGWRYIKAVQDGEVQPGWTLGRGDTTPGGGNGGGVESGESGVDETLARCWMTVHAIAVGWGQYDLLESLDNLFK